MCFESALDEQNQQIQHSIADIQNLNNLLYESNYTKMKILIPF